MATQKPSLATCRLELLIQVCRLLCCRPVSASCVQRRLCQLCCRPCGCSAHGLAKHGLPQTVRFGVGSQPEDSPGKDALSTSARQLCGLWEHWRPYRLPSVSPEPRIGRRSVQEVRLLEHHDMRGGLLHRAPSRHVVRDDLRRGGVPCAALVATGPSTGGLQPWTASAVQARRAREGPKPCPQAGRRAPRSPCRGCMARPSPACASPWR